MCDKKCKNNANKFVFDASFAKKVFELSNRLNEPVDVGDLFNEKNDNFAKYHQMISDEADAIVLKFVIVDDYDGELSSNFCGLHEQIIAELKNRGFEVELFNAGDLEKESFEISIK